MSIEESFICPLRSTDRF